MLVESGARYLVEREDYWRDWLRDCGFLPRCEFFFNGPHDPRGSRRFVLREFESQGLIIGVIGV